MDLFHQMGHVFGKVDMNSYLTTIIAQAVDVENQKTAGWSQRTGMTVHTVDTTLENNQEHADLLTTPSKAARASTSASLTCPSKSRAR